MQRIERTKWSEDELILAFNLYCKTPFDKIHNRNPEIVKLASVLGRTPSSLSWKLANFARLDPSLNKRNISGASHGSKADVEIWNMFNDNWEELIYQSEKLLKQYSDDTIETAFDDEELIPLVGLEKERYVKTRVNQDIFRDMILASYDYTCAITGINTPGLLNASHIIPWSKNDKERLNPRNGICLNTLHDRAFDRGFITINEDYQVRVSLKLKRNESIDRFFFAYDKLHITLPDKFLPNKDFLKYHNDSIFKG